MKIKSLFITYMLLNIVMINQSIAQGLSTNGRSVTEVFREDFNDSIINEDIWLIGTWFEHGGQLGRERCYVNDGFLHMEIINKDGKILSSAIQTNKKYLYGKWEARLKVSSVAGVLNSFYTIDWGDGSATRQEVDLEFLTKSFKEKVGEVHLAVHAHNLKSFNTNPDLSLDFNPSDDFHVWSIDITPEFIEWSVDDKTLLVYKYSEHEIKIDKPYTVKLNTWSQPGWVGGPSEPDALSTYLIDWIQFTPYN